MKQNFSKEEVQMICSCITTIFLDSLINANDGDPKIERDRFIMGSAIRKLEEMLERDSI